MSFLEAVKRELHVAINIAESSIQMERAKVLGDLERQKVELERDIRALTKEQKKLDKIVQMKLEWCQKNGIVIVE